MKTLSKWPKIFPPLSPEQERISNDFVQYWHEVLPKRYNYINRFNHQYVIQYAPAHFISTLEIGAGDGEHLTYEKLNELQKENYYALDIRKNMLDKLISRFPDTKAIVADCQKLMPFDQSYFDRILAIHVLEHLPNLPAAIQEMYRVCHKQKGVVSVVIPCEGGAAYTLARKISAQRIFERRYRQPYQWFIEREHVNRPDEIIEELNKYFDIQSRRYFPFVIPIEAINLCIGLTLKPKP